MSDEKSFPLSGKRRGELRQKGEVARSTDVSTAALLTAGILALLFFAPDMAHAAGQFMMDCFTKIGHTTAATKGLEGISVALPASLLVNLALFTAATGLASIVAQLAQVGISMSDKILEPQWDRFNPVTGLGQLFSTRRLFTTFQSCLKLLLIGGLCLWSAKELMHEPVFSRPVNVEELGAFLRNATWTVSWRCLLGLGLIATMDYLFQYWKFEKDHRMNTQELKDEFRQSEGSMEVKTKRRALARRLTLRRMLENMQDATILVTNPTHYAVALHYQRGVTAAPVVVAKGMRLIALRIRERALDLHIPIVENKPLARGLHRHGAIGEPIPTAYYQAVAGILAGLYRKGLQTAEEPVG